MYVKAALAVLALASASSAASRYLEALELRTPAAAPFRVLVEQTAPPITLFVHTPSGACFVAYHPGGIVEVARRVCADPPPIGPPPVGPPVSPEQ